MITAKWYNCMNECIGKMSYEGHTLSWIRKQSKQLASSDHALNLVIDLGNYQYEFYENSRGKWFKV